MGTLAQHEMVHALGRAMHHVVANSTILQPVQGVLLCDTNGMLLPDSRPKTLLCSAMPVACQKWRRALDLPLDTCISGTDEADTDAMLRNAPVPDKTLLDLLARFVVVHKLDERVAGDCPDDCGLARIDIAALAYQLRPFVQQIAANLHMPKPIVHARIDYFNVKLSVRLDECVVTHPHYVECLALAKSGHIPNPAHTTTWVLAQKAREPRNDAATAQAGEVAA